jgi:quercetin dioxygenase-like cupin family protein
MHHFGSFDETALAPDPTFAGHGDGYGRAILIGPQVGSVHTGLSVAQLEAGGVLHPHLHSYEEGFYILDGEAVMAINGQTVHLVPGDYGVVKVGELHAIRAAGGGRVRWMQMNAPQPKWDGGPRDTFFANDRTVPSSAPRLAERAPQGVLLSHFDASQIPPVGQRTTAVKGLEGVFLNWIIDEKFGAVHHRMVFIEYQPGVGIAPHDHTFEEGYFIVSGEVEATMDGKVYRGKAGDVFWTGVGCVHAFKNVSDKPVLWLETFAPQPPRENVFRFSAEWDAKARELEG